VAQAPPAAEPVTLVQRRIIRLMRAWLPLLFALAAVVVVLLAAIGRL
jgi:hypothetical protein